MLYRNRDQGINYIKTRKDHVCYGMGTLLDYASSVVAHRDYYSHV